VITRDIAGRKLVEKVLLESKEKISQILNSTSEGIYGLDVNANYTVLNPASLRILGYQDENDLIEKAHIISFITQSLMELRTQKRNVLPAGQSLKESTFTKI
jgi:PAS domain-containing protein